MLFRSRKHSHFIYIYTQSPIRLDQTRSDSIESDRTRSECGQSPIESDWNVWERVNYCNKMESSFSQGNVKAGKAIRPGKATGETTGKTKLNLRKERQLWTVAEKEKAGKFGWSEGKEMVVRLPGVKRANMPCSTREPTERRLIGASGA